MYNICSPLWGFMCSSLRRTVCSTFREAAHGARVHLGTSATHTPCCFLHSHRRNDSGCLAFQMFPFPSPSVYCQHASTNMLLPITYIMAVAGQWPIQPYPSTRGLASSAFCKECYMQCYMVGNTAPIHAYNKFCIISQALLSTHPHVST